jgi:hypothetical protein
MYCCCGTAVIERTSAVSCQVLEPEPGAGYAVSIFGRTPDSASTRSRPYGRSMPGGGEPGTVAPVQLTR